MIVQVTYLEKDFKHIIDFDRKVPAEKIIVFINKRYTSSASKEYTKIKEAISKLRVYCQLASLDLNIQVIDSEDVEFIDLIFRFAIYLVGNITSDTTLCLNVSSENITFNLGLFQAVNIVKELLEIDVTIYLPSASEDTQVYEYPLKYNFKDFFGETISYQLLDYVEQGLNLQEIQQELTKEDICLSIGTIFNRITLMEKLGLIEKEKPTQRRLTKVGTYVKQLLNMKASFFN